MVDLAMEGYPLESETDLLLVNTDMDNHGSYFGNNTLFLRLVLRGQKLSIGRLATENSPPTHISAQFCDKFHKSDVGRRLKLQVNNLMRFSL